MAPKIVCFVAVFCALQYAHAASVQKRSILDDLASTIKTTVADVQQKTADAVVQATSQYDEIKRQVSTLIDSTVANVQTQAAKVIDEIQSVVAEAEQVGRNIVPCVSGQTDAVGRAVTQTGGDLQACTDTATSALTETFADVLNLDSQALQLSSLASNCFASIGLGTLSCLTNASGTILSKALLITSSLTSDVGAFASELGQVSAQLAQCAADETSKVAAQFASILGTVQACALSGVPAA